MEKRELICIGCPLGCMLTVSLKNGEVQTVTGNTCNIGKKYAEKECTNPTRVVTSTVKVKNGEYQVVSVKTKEAIPKDKIFECVKLLKDVCVNAPVCIGDVIVKDIAGTGIDIIATRNLNHK